MHDQQDVGRNSFSAIASLYKKHALKAYNHSEGHSSPVPSLKLLLATQNSVHVSVIFDVTCIRSIKSINFLVSLELGACQR